MASEIEACVKGFPDGGAQDGYEGVLGDCPFSQRVLLTLEEKHVPYTQHLIDEYHMPDWLGQVHPEKKVPVIKDLTKGHQHHLTSGCWVPDSAKIVDYLEEKYPSPKLGCSSDGPDIGSHLFPAFKAYLQSFGKPDEEDRKTALLKQLSLLESWLEREVPYFGGEVPQAKDFELAPRLHHVQVACKAFKEFDIGHLFPHLAAYLERMRSRPSWHATRYGDDIVIDGWRRKLQAWGVEH